ncbi:cytochrome P450 2B4 [Biomphalaria pfeifferi]|uniref:Cytochrome P450 2B4 n=1 Tax=Biomphalaria pfeifferi TaxID=112525 RepID=A0AAD8B1W1_BIOPF|nr:cytochrome P450 2B4 [Biomphalaria pfeifferi]
MFFNDFGPPVDCCIGLTLLLLILVILSWFRRTDPRLPPCPCKPWPVLGHMFLLKDNPRIQLRKWRDTLGEVYSFYIGSTLVVVLNGYDVIKEALVKKADQFSDRPSFYVDQIVGLPNRGIMAASGDCWREQRSVTLSIVRTFGMGKNIMAEKMQEEIALFLKLLDSYGGHPVDIRVDTNMSISNVILSILLGQRFEYDDPVFQKLITLMNISITHVSGTSLLNFMPFLRYLPGDLFNAKKVKDYVNEMNEILGVRYVKDKGYDNYDEDNIDNFIAAYVKEKNRKLKSGEQTFLHDQDLIKIIVEMFGAGMETTSSTILWCILYTLHHPRVQDKIHQELDAAILGDRLPNIQDKTNLVYLNAVIMETQRLASTVPLSAPHLCSEDTTLRGFFIPKGTCILPNLDSVLLDEKIWGDDAKDFRPERFIDNNGCLLHPEELIPFSIGKRLCLGESIAKMELFLYLSSLFQRYTFSPEIQGVPPKMTDIFGIVAVPGAYKVRMLKRQKK